MKTKIKLPDIDWAGVGNTLSGWGENAVKFINDHKPEFLTGAFLVAAADDIRVRIGRKKDQKLYKESTEKQKQVSLEHEAEIKVLKAEADAGQEAKRMVSVLEQIVMNSNEGGDSE